MREASLPQAVARRAPTCVRVTSLQFSWLEPWELFFYPHPSQFSGGDTEVRRMEMSETAHFWGSFAVENTWKIYSGYFLQHQFKYRKTLMFSSFKSLLGLSETPFPSLTHGHSCRTAEVRHVKTGEDKQIHQSEFFEYL